MITATPLGRPEISRSDAIAGITYLRLGKYFLCAFTPHQFTVFGVVIQTEHSNEDIRDDDWFDTEWDFEQEGPATRIPS